MKPFVPPKRLTTLGKPAAGSSNGGTFDAAALVRETLARHGIGGDALAGAGGAPGLPDFDFSALKGFGGFAQTGSPLGARSAMRETFSCAAGSREYVIHVPETLAGQAPKGLVLMLHGCTQTPEDFAVGTGMNALADAHGLILVYPAQSRGANAQTCWNWFSPGDQARERGEPAILTALVREVAGRHGVPDGRVFVAGLSAGGAMAVILGQTYPDVFAAVGAHSGLPFGAARTVAEAFAAMSGSAEPQSRKVSRAVPTIVFHGNSDATVSPVNGERIVSDALTGTTSLETIDTGQAGGRGYRRIVSHDVDGAAFAEHWQVSGLGHAWSGGNGAGSYADPAGPNASAEMVRFFLDHQGGAVERPVGA